MVIRGVSRWKRGSRRYAHRWLARDRVVVMVMVVVVVVVVVVAEPGM